MLTDWRTVHLGHKPQYCLLAQRRCSQGTRSTTWRVNNHPLNEAAGKWWLTNVTKLGTAEALNPYTFPSSRVWSMQQRIQNTGESRYLGSPRHGFKRRLVQKEPKNQIHIRKNSFILNCRLHSGRQRTKNKYGWREGDFFHLCMSKGGIEVFFIRIVSSKNKNTGEKHLLDPKVNEWPTLKSQMY